MCRAAVAGEEGHGPRAYTWKGGQEQQKAFESKCVPALPFEVMSRLDLAFYT